MQRNALMGYRNGPPNPHPANAPQPGDPHHANGPFAPGPELSPTDLAWLRIVNEILPMATGLAGSTAGMFASGGNLGVGALGAAGGLVAGQAAMEAADVPRRIEQRRARPLDNPDPMLTYSGDHFGYPRNKYSPQDF